MEGYTPTKTPKFPQTPLKPDWDATRSRPCRSAVPFHQQWEKVSMASQLWMDSCSEAHNPKPSKPYALSINTLLACCAADVLLCPALEHSCWLLGPRLSSLVALRAVGWDEGWAACCKLEKEEESARGARDATVARRILQKMLPCAFSYELVVKMWCRGRDSASPAKGPAAKAAEELDGETWLVLLGFRVCCHYV